MVGPKIVLVTVAFALSVHPQYAFGTSALNRRRSVSSMAHASSSCDEAKKSTYSQGRRGFLALALTNLAILITPNAATARDEIFKPNPLTSSVLEQIRIWEQAEADNLKYGGELEAGDAGNKGKVSAYPKLLMPILTIEKELEEVNTLVHGDNRSISWPKALEILRDPKYEKISFKKTFNAYGDNIYYSDPDRANLYLGGGATPKTEQSLAYLLRNDVLTNIEDLRAELEYLMKSGETDVGDLFSFADMAVTSMKKYLAIVPPNELEEAMRLLAATTNM